MKQMKDKNIKPSKRLFDPDEFPEAKKLDEKDRSSNIWVHKNKVYQNGLFIKK